MNYWCLGFNAFNFCFILHSEEMELGRKQSYCKGLNGKHEMKRGKSWG